MRLLKKIGMMFKSKANQDNHPKDVKLEQIRSEIALTEIELRDR